MIDLGKWAAGEYRVPGEKVSMDVGRRTWDEKDGEEGEERKERP